MKKLSISFIICFLCFAYYQEVSWIASLDVISILFYLLMLIFGLSAVLNLLVKNPQWHNSTGVEKFFDRLSQGFFIAAFFFTVCFLDFFLASWAKEHLVAEQRIQRVFCTQSSGGKLKMTSQTQEDGSKHCFKLENSDSVFRIEKEYLNIKENIY